MPITDPVTDEDIREAFASRANHNANQRRQTTQPVHRAEALPHEPIEIAALPTSSNDDTSAQNVVEESQVPIQTAASQPSHEPEKITEETPLIVVAPPPPPPPSEEKPVATTAPEVQDSDPKILVVVPEERPIQPVPIQSRASKSIVDIIITTPTDVMKQLVKKEENKTKVRKHHHVDRAPFDDDVDGDLVPGKNNKVPGITKEELLTDIQAQWPPPDQKGHNRVDAYDARIAEKTKVQNNKNHLGPIPIPGVIEEAVEAPKFFHPGVILGRHFYKVGSNLKNSWRAQAGFFSKIIAVKTLQLLIINSWILAVWFTKKIRNAIVEDHDWHFMALGLFLLMLIVIRVIAKSKANWHTALSIICLTLVTIPIAYSLAAVTFTYKAFCIPMMTTVLFVTFGTLACVPFMTQMSVTQPLITRVGAVLILVYSVLILIVVAYGKIVDDMAYFATLIWFPGMLMAVVVLWVTVYEIQRIIGGYSFNVSEKRWPFAALYV